MPNILSPKLPKLQEMSHRRFALVGDPISHSPSPAMHNAAFLHAGALCTYVLRPTPLHGLAELLEELHNNIWDGLNITTPLKGPMAKALSAELGAEIDALGSRAQSVNTLYRASSSTSAPNAWRATSTDVAGIRIPLVQCAPHPKAWAGKHALVLGNGGAARAAAIACLDLNMKVSVAARRPEAGQALLETLRCRDGKASNHPGQAFDLGDPSSMRNAFAQADLILQATPIGRKGEKLAGLDWHKLWQASPTNAIAFELLYGCNTFFSESAAQQGRTTLLGWQMLLHQGAHAWQLWMDQAEAPIHVMQQALFEAFDPSHRPQP